MASQGIVPDIYCLESVVCGHLCTKVWTRVTVEKLPVGIEEENANDPKAVGVVKYSVIVGHILRETAPTVWYFLKWLQIYTKTSWYDVCSAPSHVFMYIPVYLLVM